MDINNGYTLFKPEIDIKTHAKLETATFAMG
jgi:hypothetical protein